MLADPTGFPLWTSEVRPGSTHDLTAARELVLPALYPHAARGLPVLADKGYLGAGIGVHTPVRRPAGGSVAMLLRRSALRRCCPARRSCAVCSAC